MNTLSLQLICLTGSKYPVLPYPSALLETVARVHFEPHRDLQLDFKPYIFLTLEDGVRGEFKKTADCDVFGFSCYPWNWRRSLKLAKWIRQAYPKALLVAGGPLIPEQDDEFHEFDPSSTLPFDVCVRGEGESQWVSLLEEVARSKRFGEPAEFAKIPNLAWKDAQGQWTFSLDKNQSRSPLSRHSSYIENANMLQAMQECDRLGVARVAIWETNRGCPYACSFCNWGSATRQKVRPVEEDLLFKEADWFIQNVDILNFGDANFGILPRDLKLARHLAQNAGKGRLRQVVFSAAKKNQKRVVEISALLYQAGLLKNGALIGLQSLDEKVLELSHRSNISPRELMESTSLLEQSGVPYFFDLILGLPRESEESFYRALDTLLDFDAASIRIHALAFFPNTDVFAQRRVYQIETQPWRIYDDSRFPDEDEFFDIVKSTSTLSSDQFYEMKKVSEIIEQVHYGKILFYIARFLRLSHKATYTEFYSRLYRTFRNQDSPIGYLTENGYFLKFNSGSTTSLRGPHFPFGIKESNEGFRKSTYVWLSVMERREEFFREVETYLRQTYDIENELLEDLVLFQKNQLIHFEYSGEAGKKVEYHFHWPEYFKQKPIQVSQLPKRRRVRVTYKDRHIGERPLKAYCADSYLQVAGGFAQNYDSTKLFEHKDVEIETLF